MKSNISQSNRLIDEVRHAVLNGRLANIFSALDLLNLDEFRRFEISYLRTFLSNSEINRSHSLQYASATIRQSRGHYSLV